MTQLLCEMQQELDAEWVELMLDARAMNLSVEDVSKILIALQEKVSPENQEGTI